MYVLWTVKELQKKGYGHKDRVRFLEVFNDLLQKELEGTMRRISEEMKRFRSKVESFMQIDEEEIAVTLRKKYEMIVNIENKDEIVDAPCRLS
jgi:hypothetical protein